MKKRLEQIRQLVNELEGHMESVTLSIGDRDFSALELPLIIQEIVDDLQPLLSPYQAAFYWYLFRHSIAETGNPPLLVSTRGLQSGVVMSNVRETLGALEDRGVIRREREPTRHGTPYRILLPEEIEACRNLRAQRTPAGPKPEITAADVDHYNVRANRIKVYERDDYRCRYCQKQLTRFTATLDHVTAVAEGGDNSFENLVTACLGCNSRKHKRPVGDFLAE